jgi:uncharacterized protein (TIGR00255 family)
MSLLSMTGFGDLQGSSGGLGWTWEARSVNGRGLDVRIRLPEGYESLDSPLRAAIRSGVARGSVTIGLRVVRDAGGSMLKLNSDVLDAAIASALQAGEAASRAGLDLAPMNAADLLAVRGVLEANAETDASTEEALAAMVAQIGPLVAALNAARAAEGAALAKVLGAQIDRIAGLAAAARVSAEARAAGAGDLLRSRMEALLSGVAELDTDRLAQELALLAVKSDVTEELDRLDGHVEAARDLLGADGPVGRKLDFLMQEFNREANTLCSKAQSTELTGIGLDLKVVIDQMREQVQNVE